MSVQEIRWDKGGTVEQGILIFSMEKETKIINWEQDFFVGHRIVSVVKRVAFVSDRVSYSSERSLMLHHCSESACTK